MSNWSHIRLAIDGLDGDVRVTSLRGKEEANQCFRLELVVSGLSTPEVLGRLGQVSFGARELHQDARRSLHGVIAEVADLGRARASEHRWELTFVPKAWLLTQRTNSRIFQDKTVQEVIETVLGEHDVTLAWKAQADLQPRQYCVQYQESDFGFVARLLAEEGMSFLTGSSESERHVFTVLDSVDQYEPVSQALVYRPAGEDGSALELDEHAVTSFVRRSAVCPSRVSLRDYDFQRPRLDLSAGNDSADGEHRGLEHYDHHAEYEETDVDASHASIYLEQLRRSAVVFDGVSLCRHLSPGAAFRLTDHGQEGFDGAYVVTSVVHELVPSASPTSDPIYRNRFTCIDAKQVIRPPRPVRVLRQNLETAIVVGERGQEIDTDEHGRVRVRFHWDRRARRDGRDSCWLRVVQAAAGTGWGAQFIPRVGMEVLVGFLGGDQDRPVVMGCLYNAENPTPFALPGDRTRSGYRSRSTPDGHGSNELSFRDQVGEEEVLVRAQRDYNERVGRTRSTVIEGAADRLVHGTCSDTVNGNRVWSTLGETTITSVGGRRTSIEGGDSQRVKRSQHLRVDENYMLEVNGGAEFAVEKHYDSFVGGQCRSRVVGDESETVGGDSTKQVSGSQTSSVTRQLTTNALGGLSLNAKAGRTGAAVVCNIDGNTVVTTEGAVELLISSELLIRCGESLVRIKPEEIHIQSPRVVVAGETSAVIDGGGAALGLAGNASISGGTVTATSSGGATPELSGVAILDGPSVKLKPGAAAEAAQAAVLEVQAAGLPTSRVTFFDLDGTPMEDAAYEVSFYGYQRKGRGPFVEVPQFEDVEKCLVKWGVPSVDGDEQEYAFAEEVYLQCDHPDEEESLRRKLHNLGHRQEPLVAAICAFQAALGLEITGQVVDVTDAVNQRFSVAPVPRPIKGAQ